MNQKHNPPTNNRNSTKGSEQLGRLFLQLRRMERQPRVFGEAGPLTPTEVHTIDAIGCDAGILMSELAARLGVTKGAVTQLVGRLEGKDLVKRTPHPEDSRAVMVSLTDKGKTAYHQHEILHHHFYNQLREHLNEEEISIFEKGIETLVRILRE